MTHCNSPDAVADRCDGCHAQVHRCRCGGCSNAFCPHGDGTMPAMASPLTVHGMCDDCAQDTRQAFAELRPRVMGCVLLLSADELLVGSTTYLAVRDAKGVVRQFVRAEVSL